MCGLGQRGFPWHPSRGRETQPRRGSSWSEPSLQPRCLGDPGVTAAPRARSEGDVLLRRLAPADAGQRMGTEKGSLGAAASPSCGGGDQPDPKCYVSLEHQFCCILDSVKGIQFRKHYARERRRRAKHYG